MSEGSAEPAASAPESRAPRADVRPRHVVGAIILGLSILVVFSVDVALPIGFNAAYLYVIAVLAAGLWNQRWIVFAVAALGVSLAFIAIPIKNEGTEELSRALVVYNRIGSIVVIVLTAIMVTVFISRGERLAALGSELESVADEREATQQMVTAVQRVGSIGTWSFDYAKPDFVEWSDDVAAIHGRPSGYKPTVEESLSGYDPGDRDRISAAISVAASTGEPFMEEARIIATDGTPRVVLVMGKVATDATGEPARVTGVVQDVTLWRDAASAIATQRRRFTQLATAMPFIIWTANAEGMVDFFNDAMERFAGRSVQSLVGEGWTELVHPDDMDGVWARWAQALETQETYDHEFRLSNAFGEYRWHRVSAQPEFAPDGSVVRWWGCAIDIHAVQSLRLAAGSAAKERDMILDSITDGVYSLDHDWKFRYLNRSAEGLVNRTAAELIGASVWEEFPEVVGTDLDDIYHRAMDERTVEFLTNYNPVLDKHFDIVVSPSDTGLTVFFRDMTELRRLNDQLAHAQRLESVGRLTGGIAHDFNNLLTVVVGGAEAIEADVDLSPESREMAELVLQASRRGAELTHRLLAFARRQPLDPQPTDIGAQLTSVLPLLHRTIGETIMVRTMVTEGLPLATVDPGQLENALLNLAINARDAMPEGGTLTLEAEAVHLESTHPTAHGEVAPGHYVVVAVTDTGTGIEADVVPKLFDPFFTTKLSEGSGLGLPMVWGFAKQSGGHVSVYSELGVGTTFKLYLPLAEAGATVEAPDAPIEPTPLRGSGTILLAEDDPLVQKFAAEQLRAHGYEVVVASSGPEAIETLRDVQRVDLLFTDVIMPGGMSGKDLADQVAALRPGIPVLYASGYTENVILHNGRLDAGVDLLQKPYSGKELVRRVHAAIDAATEVAT